MNIFRFLLYHDPLLRNRKKKKYGICFNGIVRTPIINVQRNVKERKKEKRKTRIEQRIGFNETIPTNQSGLSLQGRNIYYGSIPERKSKCREIEMAKVLRPYQRNLSRALPAIQYR